MSVTKRVREVTEVKEAEKLFVTVIVVKCYSLYCECSCNHVNKYGKLLIPMLPKTSERNVGRRVICALLGKASVQALDNILPSL